jgi:hypothetical protein
LVRAQKGQERQRPGSRQWQDPGRGKARHHVMEGALYSFT